LADCRQAKEKARTIGHDQCRSDPSHPAAAHCAARQQGRNNHAPPQQWTQGGWRGLHRRRGEKGRMDIGVLGPTAKRKSHRSLIPIMSLQPRFTLSFKVCSLVVLVLLFIGAARAADAKDEWKKIIDAAKKEGKVVAGGPPTANLRKQYQDTFEKRFGLELEIVLAPGWQNAGRATAEFKAGVRYFDVLHGGSGTLEPLMHDNMLAAFSDYMVLPEVKEPSQWWGGHMWE